VGFGASRRSINAFTPIEIVITGLDPVIHLLRKNFLRRWMDARIKSGHDECVSRDEVEDRFKHTSFTFQTAKTIQTRVRDPAARCARVVHEAFAPMRAWGMPGARCTRSLVCAWHW
jgi:hypothetical protein